MNDIEPGKSIGGLNLSWGYAELLSNLNKAEYEIEDLENNNFIFHYQNFKIWINTETDKIFQIGAYQNFEGKLYGKIGIGSTLNDIKQHFGSWAEDLDVWIIPDIPGICFELADNDINEEWIEETAPIEAIYVYNV